MVCLDSDIIIDFLKENAVKKNELQKKGIILATTTANTFELFKGAIKMGNSESTKSLINLLLNLKIFDFNIESSKKAAEIFEYLKLKGETIDLANVMIASIAINNNESLLTQNLSHFNRIPNLEIEKL